jgi:hypothetical protein
MPPRKPWTPQPGTYPTDSAPCPICEQENVRVFPSQHTLFPHKTDGDISTGTGAVCSGSGKATR